MYAVLTRNDYSISGEQKQSPFVHNVFKVVSNLSVSGPVSNDNLITCGELQPAEYTEHKAFLFAINCLRWIFTLEGRSGDVVARVGAGNTPKFYEFFHFVPGN